MPKSVEYALKILTCLVASAGTPVSARHIAVCLRIPGTQAAKILHQLTWAGIVRSRRGSSGGYVLARDSEEVRAGEVARLFQMPTENNEVTMTDPLLQVWRETSAGCRQNWEELTIAELARRVAAHENAYVCLGELT